MEECCKKQSRFNLIVQKQIFKRSEKNPEFFNIVAKKIISGKTRLFKWENFDEVLDRLSSPELLHWWMPRNIKYGWGGVTNENFLFIKNPQKVFRTKEGECLAQSGFQSYCLKRNGYDTGFLYVDRPMNSPDHHICYWIENENYFYLENAMSSYAGIYGPFQSLREIAKNVYEHLADDGRSVGFTFTQFKTVPFGIDSVRFRKSLGAQP